ncbi:MAG: zinc ribbon domain-containing protein [Myxococcota bacterium]
MPSFQAPYRCGQCKNRFKALIDVDAYPDAIAARRPPTLTCPSCGEKAAAFEGAPDAFVRQAKTAAADSDALPAQGRREGGDTEQPQLSRHHEGETTRLVLVGELTTGVRWRSAMDDLGGEVVVDLTRASGLSGGGVSPLVTALRAAPKSVSGVVVLGCPIALAEALRAKPIPNLRLGSVAVEADCPSCRQPRRAVVELRGRSLEDALAGGVPCPICGNPLTQAPTDDVAQRTVPLGMILGGAGVLAVVGFVVVVVGVVMFGVGEIKERMDGEMPAAVVHDKIDLGADQVTVRGHGGPYGTEEEAEAAARDKALGVLVSALAKQIAERRGVSAGTIDVPPSGVAKFVAAVNVQPQRMLVSSQTSEGDGGFEVDAEYGLARPEFDRIVADYATELGWGPLTLVRPFPPAPGLRVVKSSLEEVRAGTRVVQVDGQAIHDLDQLPEPAGGLEVTVQDIEGRERSVSLP